VSSYLERHKAQVEEYLLEDMTKSEYKTQALHCLALARASESPEQALVHAQAATAYAILEQSRRAAKR
jgi:hypothetical protein